MNDNFQVEKKKQQTNKQTNKQTVNRIDIQNQCFPRMSLCIDFGHCRDDIRIRQTKEKELRGEVFLQGSRIHVGVCCMYG